MSLLHSFQYARQDFPKPQLLLLIDTCR